MQRLSEQRGLSGANFDAGNVRQVGRWSCRRFLTAARQAITEGCCDPDGPHSILLLSV